LLPGVPRRTVGVVPYLNWKDSDGFTFPGGAVRSGKQVLLCGSGYETLPPAFAVQRRFGGLLRRYRQRRGLPITAAVGPQLPTEAGAAGEARVRLRLPTPGRRLQWRLFFEDGNGNSSDDLHVSRFGEFESLGGDAFGFGLEIPLGIRVAVDPDITISVLTPWDQGKSDFRSYLAELATDVRAEGEDDAQSLAALSEYFQDSLPDTPPRDWRFELETEELHLDEGEAATVLLRVETPTAGETAFAVQMSAEVDGEEAIVATEPFVVRMPEDGSEPAELLGGGGEGGGDSQLDQPEELEESEETLGVQAAGSS
jgi:hypothetical protein